MKENKLEYKLLQWLIYPITIYVSVYLFFIFINTDKKLLFATYIPLLFSAIIIVLSEYIIPYKHDWKPTLSDWKNDTAFLIIVQILLPKFLIWFCVFYIIDYLKINAIVLFHIWPHHLPIGIQEVMVVLISDFLRYWLHRFNHTVPILWQIHAVHHSVKKLYWLNTSRFHPIEKATQFMLDVLPFMLLGVSEKVIALHFVLYAVNGFFQHSNINLKFGWLNYIVSSSELHRYHHSKEIKESNNNYGNNIILWDLIFGSFYLPKNSKQIGELGLYNPNYPLDFKRQMKAILFNQYDKIDMPDISFSQLLLNQLLNLRMIIIKMTDFKSILFNTKNCESIQRKLLKNILSHNKNTSFGKEYSFVKCLSYEDFKQLVPVFDYEMLRPFIQKQAEKSTKEIVNDELIMFNKTSGTTSEPKLIPITQKVLETLHKNQGIFSYIQYQIQPTGYAGKLLGIVSPAYEGMSDYNIAFGSASGHIYKTMPALARQKYVLPYEVFDIKDHELKYYCILLLSLQHKDITYFGIANPTTFLKLLEILNKRKTELLKDLKSKSILNNSNNCLDSINLQKIINEIQPSKERLTELEILLTTEENLTFKVLWPYIKLITTWTGGSCGIALKSVLKTMPKDITVIDLGYLSSEVRATITYDLKTQAGLPTYQDTFFEFVERIKWENGQLEFRLLHELELNIEYYIFITNQGGLYRYNMNDIIRVVKFINQLPLIKFIQKGKGICNITGEKLYESQVLNAWEQLSLDSTFIQILANEENMVYECYIETLEEINNLNELANTFDELLCLQNIEYKEKRLSRRLQPIKMKLLKQGTYEIIKLEALKKGQNENQYKTILLQYKKQFPIDLELFTL